MGTCSNSYGKNEMKPQTLHIVEQPTDNKYMEDFREELRMLCGMVQEMMTHDRGMLLSPVMRESLLRVAIRVQEMTDILPGRLHVDNLGTPLFEKLDAHKKWRREQAVELLVRR